MKKFLVILTVISLPVFGQTPNCSIYLYKKDTAQYNACKSIEHVSFYQYTKQYQLRFDNALKICPRFGYAYKAKSTAYLKSGDFLSWKNLIDKAVEYDSINLGYRGWCRLQFFRDYKGAIEDIEMLERQTNSIHIGYSADGTYHLIVAKALCYSALNEKKKAVEIFEKLFLDTTFHAGQYDFYHLAVTYFQIDDFINAQKYFDKQSKVYNWAENNYYQARLAKMKGDTASYNSLKAEAVKLYKENKIMFNPYTEEFNKVFYETIISE